MEGGTKERHQFEHWGGLNLKESQANRTETNAVERGSSWV